MTGFITLIAYCAHLAALAKGQNGEKYIDVEKMMMWRKNNPTADDLKMLEHLRTLRH
jgi:hypothetical protein